MELPTNRHDAAADVDHGFHHVPELLLRECFESGSANLVAHYTEWCCGHRTKVRENNERRSARVRAQDNSTVQTGSARPCFVWFVGLNVSRDTPVEAFDSALLEFGRLRRQLPS